MTIRKILFTLLILTIFCGHGFAASQSAVPRTILALYDSKDSPDIRTTRLHRFAEMPLNHLGLKLKFFDIQKGLPSSKNMQDVRGVITWFESDRMPDPIKFISWANGLMNEGIRWVVFGNLGINENAEGKTTPLTLVNGYLANLGLQTEGNWKPITYDVKLTHKDPEMVGFERPYAGVLSPFPETHKHGEDSKVFLTASWGKNRLSKSDLIVIGPHGGYAAPGYLMYERADFYQWYLNPFEFFRLAFKTDALPKPDTTTVSGRRIYYSHIDGDGWRNVTEIEKYKETQALSAEVIFKEALAPFPDLPVTLAPIAGDLDPQWYGNENSLSLARKMLALPHVEAGSHTYSHPYYWNYYRNHKPEKEWKEFLAQREKPDSPIGQRFAPFVPPVRGPKKGTQVDQTKKDALIPKIYDYPRAYLDYPFDLEKEIKGSIDFINKLCPPGKEVTVLQWSGDTSPFPAAIGETRKVRVANINGGDSRFDAEFPSHAWVSPIGIHNEDQLQIYASASNENTYTDLWQDRFFGFQYLPQTLKKTESPRRLKPINIYYHLYSGQKTASLNALLKNLKYVQKEEVAPVSTSHFAKIAEGFFSTRIIPLGEKQWRIKDRGALQTIRFDRADSLAVDMKRSRGIVGQRHYQGSLYVSLNAFEEEPIIALAKISPSPRPPNADQPYLVQGRWRVWNLEFPAKHRMTFTAQGFGEGEMVWKVPKPGRYEIQLFNSKDIQQTLNAEAGKDGLLKFKFGAHAIDPVQVKLSRDPQAL